jgi:hypothetical protein
MKKSPVSIAVAAFMTAISFFLLALAYPKLFVLLGLLLVTACVIFGLFLIAAIPEATESICKSIREFGASEEESDRCKYCGMTIPSSLSNCPNCGAPRAS